MLRVYEFPSRREASHSDNLLDVFRTMFLLIGLKACWSSPPFFDVNEADYSVEEVFDKFLLIQTLPVLNLCFALPQRKRKVWNTKKV
jgi:hypothetical protein